MPGLKKPCPGSGDRAGLVMPQTEFHPGSVLCPECSIELTVIRNSVQAKDGYFTGKVRIHAPLPKVQRS